MKNLQYKFKSHIQDQMKVPDTHRPQKSLENVTIRLDEVENHDGLEDVLGRQQWTSFSSEKVPDGPQRPVKTPVKHPIPRPRRPEPKRRDRPPSSLRPEVTTSGTST